LQFLQIVDACLLVVAFWATHTIRYVGHITGFLKNFSDMSEYQWVLFVLVPFGPIFLEAQGFYDSPNRKNFGRSIVQLARAAVFLGVLIAACAYFLKLPMEHRTIIPIFTVLAGTLLLLRERFTISRYKRRLHSELLRERIILSGSGGDIRAFRENFTPDQVMELEVVDELDIETRSPADLVESLHKHSVARVIFVGRHSQIGKLEEYIGACEVEGVEAWLSADFIRIGGIRPDFDAFGSRPMLVFRSAPGASWALMLKHTFDRVLAFIILLLFFWLFLLIALAIRFTSSGPIVFRQMRGGKNGKPFTMYKFRTMVTNAEMQREELMVMNQMSGPVFKVESDPRVTKIGKLLRKTSLDELPQLWNIIRGDMSLVGPRPLPIYEVEKFETTAQRRRLSMKPGVTCLWQISGRNNITDFKDWVKLDLQYIDNWSLWLDLEILLRTVPAVFFGRGAK